MKNNDDLCQTRTERPLWSHSSSVNVFSAAVCLSATSDRTMLFMALCISHVLRWMVTNAPPDTHSQFLLSQLWGFILHHYSSGPLNFRDKIQSSTIQSKKWLVILEQTDGHLEKEWGFPAAHLAGSLALGSGRSCRSWDVGDDAWFRDKFLFGFVQQGVCLQLVPAKVD